MKPRRATAAKRSAALLGLFIILAAAMGYSFVTLANDSHSQSSSSIPGSSVQSTHSAGENTSTVNTVVASKIYGGFPISNASTSEDGLSLTVGINASRIIQGETIRVSASIGNTLSATNDVPVANAYPFQGVMMAMSPGCGGTGACLVPAMAVVLSGNFTLQEIEASRTAGFNYSSWQVTVDHVIFQPDSDQANITGFGIPYGTNITRGPYEITTNFTTAGSWNFTQMLEQAQPSIDLGIPLLGASPCDCSPPFAPFVPSVYTIAVADEWGAAVVLHVVVDPQVAYGQSQIDESNPSNGLELALEIHPSADGNLTMTATDVNTFDSFNKISKGDDWRYPPGIPGSASSSGFNPFGGCDATTPPGLAVFQGHFDLSNITSAKALALVEPRVYMCTTTNAPPKLTYYTFYPNSAEYADYIGGAFYANYTASVSISIGGFWTGNFAFRAFTPGVYTVLAGDEWGDVTMLYFAVSDNGTISAGSGLEPTT